MSSIETCTNARNDAIINFYREALIRNPAAVEMADESTPEPPEWHTQYVANQLEEIVFFLAGEMITSAMVDFSTVQDPSMRSGACVSHSSRTGKIDVVVGSRVRTIPDCGEELLIPTEDGLTQYVRMLCASVRQEMIRRGYDIDEEQKRPRPRPSFDENACSFHLEWLPMDALEKASSIISPVQIESMLQGVPVEDVL